MRAGGLSAQIVKVTMAATQLQAHYPGELSELKERNCGRWVAPPLTAAASSLATSQYLANICTAIVIPLGPTTRGTHAGSGDEIGTVLEAWKARDLWRDRKKKKKKCLQ